MHACRGGHINSISNGITVLARNLRLHSILHNRNIANMQAVASCWGGIPIRPVHSSWSLLTFAAVPLVSRCVLRRQHVLDNRGQDSDVASFRAHWSQSS